MFKTLLCSHSQCHNWYFTFKFNIENINFSKQIFKILNYKKYKKCGETNHFLVETMENGWGVWRSRARMKEGWLNDVWQVSLPFMPRGPKKTYLLWKLWYCFQRVVYHCLFENTPDRSTTQFKAANKLALYNQDPLRDSKRYRVLGSHVEVRERKHYN